MPRGQRAETRDAKGRQERVLLGMPKPKLSGTGRKGFHQHWFVDRPGRIDDAQAAGYAQVMAEDGRDEDGNPRSVPVRKRVGVHEDGTPQWAYLMEKPQEMYDEDQRRKAEPLDEIERAIRSGKPMGGTEEAGAYYNAGSSLKATR